MEFNYKLFNGIFAGSGKYTFANPEKVAAENPNNAQAARNEYRLNLARTAKGLIRFFDADGDGKLNLDEFSMKEADCVARVQYKAKGIETDSLDEKGRKEFESYRNTLKEMSAEGNKKSFEVLDLDGNGLIDYKEVASEISLAGRYDANGQDGTIEAIGYHSIYNDNKSPEQANAELKENYQEMNLQNLDEPQDNTTSTQQPVVAAQQPVTIVQQVTPVIIQNVAPSIVQQPYTAVQNITLAETILNALLSLFTGRQNNVAQIPIQTGTTTSGVDNLLRLLGLVQFTNGGTSTPVIAGTTRAVVSPATTRKTTTASASTQPSASKVSTPTTGTVITEIDHDSTNREDIITTAPSADAVAMDKAIQEGYDAYDAV